jgi:phage terminase Nu1 subunit (DNA packaging protein)
MPFLDRTDENGVVSKIEWTPLSKTKFDRSKEPNAEPVLTFGQEIEEAVKTWYREKGMPVPPEDLQVCREIDGIQQAEHERLTAEPAKPKPVYGTPEFWKDWWAKKKAKEAAGESKEEPKKQKSSVPKSAKRTGQASQS